MPNLETKIVFFMLLNENLLMLRLCSKHEVLYFIIYEIIGKLVPAPTPLIYSTSREFCCCIVFKIVLKHINMWKQLEVNLLKREL